MEPLYRGGPTFAELAKAVRLDVRALISSGEISERRAAARCGISQPHFHSWLAGRDSLSLRTLDRVVGRLGLSIRERPTADRGS